MHGLDTILVDSTVPKAANISEILLSSRPSGMSVTKILSHAGGIEHATPRAALAASSSPIKSHVAVNGTDTATATGRQQVLIDFYGNDNMRDPGQRRSNSRYNKLYIS